MHDNHILSSQRLLLLARQVGPHPWRVAFHGWELLPQDPRVLILVMGTGIPLLKECKGVPFLSVALMCARIASLFWPKLSGLSSSACTRLHACSILIALAGQGVAPSSPLAISDTGPQITALPHRSMLAGQQITPLMKINAFSSEFEPKYLRTSIALWVDGGSQEAQCG